MEIINPYSSVDWANTVQKCSCSHAHCKTQVRFDRLVDGGLEHLALSNYHPSEPWYPLANFFSVPSGIIGSPNAEFSRMDIDSFHINGLGSFYSEPEPAPIKSWKYKFSQIIANLQYDDGGGVTINHPTWSIETAKASGNRYLTKADLFEMLDFDNRVLGIEFYNALDVLETTQDAYRWAIGLWDDVLLTGRRCWGFCVSDHDGEREDGEPWRGRNVLLPASFTEHDCLIAYRNGAFYGSIYNTSLRFTNISLNGNQLSVSATDADYLNFIVNKQTTQVNGNTATFTIPGGAIYVRVEAHNDDNSIYSNPIILRPYRKRFGDDEDILLLF